MRTVTYKDIPSLSQWKHDSSVSLATRKHEPGLSRLDELVAAYDPMKKDLETNGPLLIDLFLTIEYWFKMRADMPRRVEEGRLPAMRGLFEVVVAKLAPFFANRDGHTSPALVSGGIKEFVGLGMSTHGFSTDSRMGFTQFSTRQVWSYRLWFKHGRAYQVPWWAGRPNGKLEPANSKYGYHPIIRRDPGNEVAPAMHGWSPFIMTLSRYIYMAKHDFDADRYKDNYFHSSYNDGHRVGMAGTMSVINGVITAIRLDSGHYHPGLHSLTSFLLALRMYQVDLRKISLLDFRGDWIGDVTASADDFLRSGRSWETFKDGAKGEVKKQEATRFQRQQRWA
jgi:hypothetical protein